MAISIHISFHCMPQVYRISWWMAHYGSESPKRHLALTNNAWAHKLNMGKRTKDDRKKCTKKTVVKYQSKSGRASYKGTKELKSTQTLAIHNCARRHCLLSGIPI